MKHSEVYFDATRYNTKAGYEGIWMGNCGTEERFQKFFNTYKERFKIVAQNIIGISVLDIGCGVSLIPHFRKQILYAGIDFSENAIKIMKERYPEVLVINEKIGNKINFPDNVFDTVIALEFIEHIPDYRPIIEEMKRVASRRVIITVPQGLSHRTHFHPSWSVKRCNNLFDGDRLVTNIGRWRMIIWNKEAK